MNGNGAKTKRTISALLLVATCASPAAAFDDPDGFRGVPWGASEDQLRTTLDGPQWRDKKAQWYLQNVGLCDNVAGRFICFGDFKLGDTQVKTTYRFRDGAFVAVSLTFQSDAFAQMMLIFRERYGSPTTQAQREYKTRGGVTTTNQILQWQGAKTLVRLEQYGSRLTEGFAWIGMQEEWDRLGHDLANQAKDAAKGL